uniref:3-oxo-5alpha-steroid 4-dehydrogenase (NADP(+)) n=1 Tax=Ascaris suum TaxID=6253 RepID=F1LAZ4_ASCSU
MWLLSTVVSMLENFLLYEEQLVLFISYSMIVCAVVTFLWLTGGAKAAYGRYHHESVLTEFSIPARLAWVLQEIPSFLIPLVYLITSFASLPSPNIVVLSLFIAHYAQRSLIYSVLIKGGKATPLHIFLMAAMFCTGNGFIQGAWHAHYATFNDKWFYDPLTWTGLTLFALGAFVNVQSDSILRNLRRPGERGYKIPRGGLFEYVSGANYLGECVEWIGYALCARTLPSFAFAIFTLCNIGPRAVHHHRWYIEKFEDYPKTRKAIIPFIL